MNIFNFFRKKISFEQGNEIEKKTWSSKLLNNSQKVNLVEFTEELENIFINYDAQRINNDVVSDCLSHLNKLFQNLKNYDFVKPNLSLYTDCYDTMNVNEKKKFFTLIIPIEELANKYLNTVCTDLNSLMEHLENYKTEMVRINKKIDEGWRFHGLGIDDDRDEWYNKISEHWYQIAKFIFEVEHEKKQLFM